VRRVGPYEVAEELGRGGMGIVYRARDSRTGGLVALKVLHEHRAEDPRALQRTRTEVRALGRLRHRHIVPVLDAGESPTPYLVMAFVEGEPLDERLRRGPLPVEEALRLAKEQADALAHAHAQGILHRDLKPANVLMRPETGSCLTDFGLARDLEDAHERLTQTGVFFGTPGYWAPEQARGRKDEVSFATDVYGWAALVYAALTGGPPVDGETLLAFVRTGAFAGIRPLRDLRPDAPPWLETLLARCLHYDPALRPNFDEVRAKLQQGGEPARIRVLLLCTAAFLVLITFLTWRVLASDPGESSTPEASVAQGTPSPTLGESPSPAATAQAPGAAALKAGLSARASNDHVSALRAFRSAAEAGESKAMYWLAQAYLTGKGAPASVAKAREWARRGALGGDPRAQQLYGAFLSRGRGGAKDPAEARDWLRKAVEGGHLEALASLGSMLEHGRGGPKDPQEASRLYRLAAERGHLRAMSKLGSDLLRAGEGEEAVLWLQKAGARGDANALCNLGYAYEIGRGVEQSDQDAVRCYLRASALGNAQATANLGECYAEGRGVAKDESEATALLKVAADAGIVTAMRCLAKLCLEATTIPTNQRLGLHWYQQAAKRGDAESMVRLAELCERDEGQEETGLAWARAAAEGGYAPGMIVFARYLAAGRGSQANPSQARAWLQRAIEQGDAESQRAAQEALELLPR